MEQILPLALFVLQEAIKYEPALEAEIRALFAKPEITAADWIALRLRVANKTYADYVPESALLPAPVAPAPAAPPPVAPIPAADPTPAAPVFTGQTTDPHAV